MLGLTSGIALVTAPQHAKADRGFLESTGAR